MILTHLALFSFLNGAGGAEVGSITEGFSISDTMSAVAIASASNNEAFNLSDTQARAATLIASISEGINYSDTITASYVGIGAISDTINLNDTNAATASTIALLTDTISIADTFSYPEEVSTASYVFNDIILVPAHENEVELVPVYFHSLEIH